MAEETPSELARSDRLRRERETKAEDLRLAQALRDQKVDLTLESHATDIRELRKGHADTARSIAQLVTQVQTLTDTLPQTIANAIDKALAKQTAKALSSKQLWIAALTVAVPLIVLAFKISAHS